MSDLNDDDECSLCNELKQKLLESEASNAVMREALDNAYSNIARHDGCSRYQIADSNALHKIEQALSTTAGQSLLEKRDRLRSAIDSIKNTFPEAHFMMLRIAETPQPTETKEKE